MRPLAFRLGHRIAARLGYPGLVLVVFGWFWCWTGVGVLAVHDYNPQLVYTRLPTWIRVTLWGACGGASMICAWSRRRHKIGFALLFIPPFERAIGYLWALAVSPSLGWLVGASVWCSMVFAVIAFAAWPEPPELPDAPERSHAP